MTHYYIEMTDLQQLSPAGWCPCCGAEIYAASRDLCTRCQAQAQEDDPDV